MSEEEKGFVIKDKRSFTPEGEPIKGEEEKKEAAAPEETKSAKEAEKEQEPKGRSSLPEVTFPTFIFSLVSSVMLHLGQVPDPTSGETRKDLELAKHTIDIIAMLKEKTQGNLSDEEQKMIDHVLYDLRMSYVKTKG